MVERPTTPAAAWLGRRVRGAEGSVLGTVEDVLLDSCTESAEWAVLRLHGLRRRYRAVPVSMLCDLGEELRAATSHHHLAESPRVRPRGPMTASRERTLTHYWHRR